ncbi:MAG TPA: hypothetical protein VFX81_07550 [Burkholderiaceae bacterium]|nr:hypothetical protein [Burkholderiaceae bacterium]
MQRIAMTMLAFAMCSAPAAAAMMRRLDDGAWNLNRFKERKDVPGVTKEQLETVKAKY